MLSQPNPEAFSEQRSPSCRGSAGGYPASLAAYRWFFLISLAMAVMVAGILYFWNQHTPIKEENIENKRPQGLE